MDTAAASIIRQARIARGLSQADLARALSLPSSTIARLERKGYNPRFSTVQDVARALGAELVLVPRERLPLIDAVLHGQRELADEEEPPLIPEGEL